MNPISTETIDRIISLRRDNKTVQDIGNILNISKSTVAKYVKILNLDLLLTPKLDDSIINRIFEYDNSVTNTKISKELNISVSAVTKYRKLNGYKRELLSELEKKRRSKFSYTKNKREYKKKCVDYLGGKCIVCGYDKSLNALEFHHRNPDEKEFTISGIRRGWEETKKELDKCDLLCANCHREEHERINGSYR